jgi:hypothetical protein
VIHRQNLHRKTKATLRDCARCASNAWRFFQTSTMIAEASQDIGGVAVVEFERKPL